MSTSASPPLMIRLLSASVAAATRAGQIIRQIRGSGELGIVNKGYDDPQTEADRKAQRCIVTTLETRFPGIKIVGEETLAPSAEDGELVVREESEEVLREQCPPEHVTVQDKDVVVWVDPLDGTKEFTLGILEDVTVLIGIAVKGSAVGGVIHQPFHTKTSGRTIWGLTGLGVRGQQPCSPPSSPPSSSLGDGPSLTITRSHYSDTMDKIVKHFKPRELIKAGGCGRKIMQVLEGRVDTYIYPTLGTKKWDSCAGEALVKAAGGTLTDVLGGELNYEADTEDYHNREGLVVTMHNHEAILAMIPEEVKKTYQAYKHNGQ